MNDYYMIEQNCVDRLVREWQEHGKIIIAYDFDDTVYDYHNKGLTYDKVIELLRECNKQGAYFIVSTCCGKDKYEFIKLYLKSNDIPFDKINGNLSFIELTGRKVYANILLDDRAGLKSSYEILKKALKKIQKGEK